ncbi:MAG: hypothetical protein GXP55_11230 [Deltaproteobacteria bacterium]|nr:hypothetical protein [Deltaproteobacteria bacterium]
MHRLFSISPPSRGASLLALVLASGVSLGACGGGGNAGPDGGLPDAAVDSALDAGPDLSEQLFRPDHVLEISITLAPADWAALRAQPDRLGIPNISCGAQPLERAYSYFSGEITVDGVTVGNVGIRKKGGFGSISNQRPGLKIKASKFVRGQRIFGLKRLTLNNNVQDPTLVSQCLGYGLFAQAGIPAARCSFAHVTVNGQDLGIYSNVETLKKSFLRRHFADVTGRLYESGGEFLPGSIAGFQPKTNKRMPDCTDLDPVAAAVAGPDADFVPALSAVVDVDEFITFWAMEVITDHWDGYANNQNNYYFYHDPITDRLQFMPWGIDALFTGRERTTRPDSVFACGRMAWRLYAVPETRARYLARLRELLDTVWDEAAILAEIDRMQALLDPFVTAYVDAATRDEWLTNVQRTRDFVSAQRGVLLAELDAGEPVWPFAAEESCRIVVGDVSGDFDTTWGTLDDYTTGSGSTDGMISGVSTASTTTSSNSGLSADGKPLIQVLSRLPDGRILVVALVVQDVANFVPGTRSIDLANVAAFTTFYDPATDTASGGGLILGGSLTLTSADMTPGGSVTGSFSGQVLEL